MAEAEDVPADVAEEESEDDDEPSLAVSRPKRVRKSVERMEYDAPKVKEHAAVQEGKGTKLRDMDVASSNLNRILGTDVAYDNLHTLFYGSAGKKGAKKTRVLDFSGFVFKDEAEKASVLEKRRAKLSKKTTEVIHRLMDLCDADRSSTTGGTSKAEVIDRFLDWMMEPKASGRAPRGKRKGTTAKAREARKAKTLRKIMALDKNAPKRPKSAYAIFVSESYAEAGPSSSEGGEKVSLGERAKVLSAKWNAMSDEEKKQFQEKAEADKERYKQEMEEYDPPTLTEARENARKGKRKRSSAAKSAASKKQKKDSKSKKAKKEKKKKKKKKKSKKKRVEAVKEDSDSESSSDEDEELPMSVMAKVSAGKLKSRIAAIIKTADLATLSIKQVRKQLEGEFDVSLRGCKDTIKTWIMECM